MPLFRSELSKGDHEVSPFPVSTDSLHIVSGVAWRVYCFNLAFGFVPKVIHMASSPTRISCHLVGVSTAPLVKFDEHLVVKNLELLQILVLVVELLFLGFNVIYHVGAHRWVVSVRVYLWSKKHPHEWIPETNTHWINENIAWLQRSSMNRYSDESYSLQNHCHHWIVGWVQAFRGLLVKMHKIYIWAIDFNSESLCNFGPYHLTSVHGWSRVHLDVNVRLFLPESSFAILQSFDSLPKDFLSTSSSITVRMEKANDQHRAFESFFLLNPLFQLLQLYVTSYSRG